jgi:hypothetical protein
LKTSIGLGRGAITMKIFSERENRNKFSERLIYCDFDFTRIVSLLLAIKVSLINCRFSFCPSLLVRPPFMPFPSSFDENCQKLEKSVSLHLPHSTSAFFMLRFVNKKTSNERKKDPHPPRLSSLRIYLATLALARSKTPKLLSSFSRANNP